MTPGRIQGNGAMRPTVCLVLLLSAGCLALTGCGPLFPPASVTDLTVDTGPGRVTLTWTNPGDRDLAGIRVMRRPDAYPVSPEDGMLVYDGLGTTATETGLSPGSRFFYAVFSYDNYGNHAPAAGVTVTVPGA